MKLVNIAAVVATAFGALALLGMVKKPGSVYKNEPYEQNPFEGECG